MIVQKALLLTKSLCKLVGQFCYVWQRMFWVIVKVFVPFVLSGGIFLFDTPVAAVIRMRLSQSRPSTR